MFINEYETWKKICNMYFSLPLGMLRSYFQLYPFSKLSKTERDILSSENFFHDYIHLCGFALNKKNIFRTDHFIQKADGSFREASLVSPILFLTVQGLGKEISDIYYAERPKDIIVYYGGNYECLRPLYKKDYDLFFKEINIQMEEFQYFIKVDISNFYSSININKLIERIDIICNKDDVKISQAQLYLNKGLLNYCGKGKFPIIECSVALSYLSTIIYLDEVDTQLHSYISNTIKNLKKFRMIRYVDDLYILLNLEEGIQLKSVYNEIINVYNSILKKWDLTLNSKKSKYGDITEINIELKKSLYDEIFYGKSHDIEELFDGKIVIFFEELIRITSKFPLSIQEYNEKLDEVFNLPDIQFTPTEVLNYYIFNNDNEWGNKKVIESIEKLLNNDVNCVDLDPKRFTLMILKTRSQIAIKKLLNALFERHRNHMWQANSTIIQMTYLIQRNFINDDLIKLLKERNPELYSYYFFYCENSLLDKNFYKDDLELSLVLNEDAKSMFLYIQYLFEISQYNYLPAFSYFKNFFDRVTAHLAFLYVEKSNNKRPNYNKYYSEKTLKNFYKNIPNSEHAIKKAHKIRNMSPISHASSELLDNNNSTSEIIDNIQQLSNIISEYIFSVENK